jgi:hypothetical protein
LTGLSLAGLYRKPASEFGAQKTPQIYRVAENFSDRSEEHEFPLRDFLRNARKGTGTKAVTVMQAS